MAGKARSLQVKTRKTEVFGSINLHRKRHLWVGLKPWQNPARASTTDPSTLPGPAAERGGLDAAEDCTRGHSEVSRHCVRQDFVSCGRFFLKNI